MPGKDGTGPMGMGPMTGRAAGQCAGYAMPGNMNLRNGHGRGMGFVWPGGIGGGFGRRNMFRATGMPGWMRAGMAGGVPAVEPTPEQERSFLKSQADALQAQLDGVRKRLEEMETAKAD
ncbi:MAG: DUF5320 domain-containing protein [Planctomycetota bacterium]